MNKMRTFAFCMQVVGSACFLVIAAGAGKLLWTKFWHSVVAVGPLPPSITTIAAHLGVIVVAGMIGLVLAIKAVRSVDRDDLRALVIVIQIAAALLGGFSA